MLGVFDKPVQQQMLAKSTLFNSRNTKRYTAINLLHTQHPMLS